MDPYILRAEGQHESDVKWTCAFPASNATPATLVSASRDRTSKSWILPAHGAGQTAFSLLEPACIYAGHTHFVNFALFLSSVGCAGDIPMIASGSHDKNVLLFNVETSALDGVLCGHDDVVKCGTVLPDGRLVTGSWDNSCIVWDLATGTLARRVHHHTNNIACVAAFEQDEVLSCGGDKTIARWNATTGELLGRYVAHEDTVQAVVSLTGSVTFRASFGVDRLFASAGNDSVALLWNADAPKAPLARFTGHESIIYHLSVNLHTGELLSAGDDNTLRVWGPTACVQCIFHPALVWSSCVFPDEDVIATGCSDGYVRVWTRNVGDMASTSQIETLEQTVARTKLAAKLALHGIDPEKLPSRDEVMATVGEFEGQRALGRVGQFIYAFAWNQNRWDQIGVVVSGEDDDGSNVTKKRPREKKYHNGQQFDYLFDVDIQGVPLKLCYNRGQSIFDAAQLFIYENAEMGISQADKEQIQTFILDNIEPEDAALVGGAVGNRCRTDGGSSGGGAYAFSEYAKELAEAQAKGESDNKGSYRDEYKRMIDKGEVPNFSTYAQEEAAAAAAAAGRPVAAPTAGASGGVPISALISQAAGDADLFTGFAAAGATKKLVEFGIAEADIAPIATAVQEGRVGEHEIASLCVLADGLPPGNRFPIVDMIRAVAATNPAALETCGAGVAALVASLLQSTSDADAERLVALRTTSNVFVQAAVAPSAEAPQMLLALEFMERSVLSAIVAAMRRATSRQAAPPLKAAALRTISALALCVSRLCDFGVNDARMEGAAACTVSCIAFGLIVELDNTNVKQLVRAALVLTCGPNPNSANHAARHAGLTAAAKEIFGIVRAKKEYGDPDIIAGCKHLYELLSPLVPVARED
jgi:phospholipase A-2-activating protein